MWIEHTEKKKEKRNFHPVPWPQPESNGRRLLHDGNYFYVSLTPYAMYGVKRHAGDSGIVRMPNGFRRGRGRQGSKDTTAALSLGVNGQGAETKEDLRCAPMAWSRIEQESSASTGWEPPTGSKCATMRDQSDRRCLGHHLFRNFNISEILVNAVTNDADNS
ncbi:hypothetical protein B0H19DRAFT_1077863 [Mycena capillaripes]|nr:hypothetical protein B0H19DRAFT_1077863 [Mycena capillaripes]